MKKKRSKNRFRGKFYLAKNMINSIIIMQKAMKQR